MPFTVTADPTVAFVDAIKAKLDADSTLDGLVTSISGHPSGADRTAYPYVVLGRRTAEDAGALGIAGSKLTLQVDVWSGAKGPAEATAICSRIYALLERAPLTVTGFTYIEGSLTRALQEVFDEPDEDKPDSRLYHGVQRWEAELHERI